MGNKFSIVSATSSRSSSSTKSRNNGQSSRDRSQSVAHIPKHLKPAKPLKKHQRERLEKQHLKQQQNERSGPMDGIGVAVPYQPYMNQQQHLHHGNNSNNTIANPPFSYLKNEKKAVMNVQQPQQNNDEFEGNVTTINNDGAKTAFQWFEGRRYQNQDDCILPNDQRELDRLRVLNYILRWAFEGDVVAPVKSNLIDGTHVLSVGCGPGIWLGHPVIDFALDYKKSHFTAVDILDLLPDQDMDHSHDTNASARQQANQSYFEFSPLHPMLPTTMTCSTWYQQNMQLQQQQQHTSSSHSHPSQEPSIGCPTSDHSTLSSSDQTTSTSSFSGLGSSSSHSTTSRTIRCRSVFDNLDTFALDVREYGLPFDNDSFEFVMQRLSTPAYSNDQWHRVVGELIRVTRPGGYLQFIEIDYNSQNLGPAGQAWQEKLCEALAKTRKLNPFMASQIDTVLEEHGLVNVKKKKISMPFGVWGLDIGVLWQQNLEAFIEASAPALGMALGISAAECKSMWKGYKDELDFVKAFTNVYAVTGQKPHLVV